MCGEAPCALSAPGLSHFSITTKGVGAELRLKAADALGVHRWPVFDTSLLGMDRRHVGVKFLQDRLPHAGFGGDDCNHVDHLGSPQAMRSKTLWWRLVKSGRILVAQSPYAPASSQAILFITSGESSS